MTTGGNPLGLPCWCFHFSCRLQPSFSPSEAFSPSSSHFKSRPGTLGKHCLWHEGSNWGSDGTPEVVSFLHLWLPACHLMGITPSQVQQECESPDGSRRSQHQAEVRSNPLHTQRIADSTTNRVCLLKQCERSSFSVTRC